MPNISPQTEELITIYRKKPFEELYFNIPKIHIDYMITRLTLVYEKIRNAIDYKEEHLIRKNAVNRILKRILMDGKIEYMEAHDLVYELIRAGYLKNDTIPENKIDEIKKIVEKYIDLLNKTAFLKYGKERSEYSQWILSLVSCEIDNSLTPPIKKNALVNFAYSVLHKNIVLVDKTVSEKEKNLQVFIAIHKALVKSDVPIIRYALFKLYYPNWEKADKTMIEEAAIKFDKLKSTIDKQINHPYKDLVLRTVRKYNAIFMVLDDIINENIDEAYDILEDPDKLERVVKISCERKYRQAASKLQRSVIRAFIYIFITKMTLALIIELPFDLISVGIVHWFPLGINLIFHPFLLFVIAMAIDIPAGKNTNKIYKSLKAVIYQTGDKAIFETQQSIKRRPILNTIFNIIYSIIFIITFVFLIYFLRRLDFNAISIALFVLFLSVVSFFGIKVRQTVKELIVVGQRQYFVTLLFDFFSVPILRAGRWITEKAPQINILAFFLDFIIEAPFKLILEVIEDWLSFMREKKEEII